MTIPTPRIEIFVDLTSVNAPFFELDSDTEGLLDGDFRLGGLQWIDITPRAKSIRVSRGRTSIFGYNSAAQLAVDLNNHDRAFDPIWEASELYGAVVPTVPVRLYLDDIISFTGTIEDWDLSYTPSYDNVASFSALDAFADWSRLNLAAYTPASLNTTAEAIQEALTEAGITQAAPDPAAGIIMTTAPVADGTNLLQYVQKLATSDFGSLYIKKDGSWDYVPFERRITGVIKGRIGSGTSRPIHLASVAYGSENLYNKVTIGFTDSSTIVSAQNDDSIAKYGERDLRDDASLISSAFAGAYGGLKAEEVLAIYSEPELRIDSVELKVQDYSEADQEFILNLELGDRLIVAFDPNNSGNDIVRIARIIGINHSVNPQEHLLALNFESSSTTPLTLNDITLGRLDAGNFLERTWDFSI